MIRIIIVDDEILSRIGIRSFIDGKEDISVAEVFENAIDALAWLRENTVDIVITDIEMAEMSGLAFIKILREENLATGVIILSCHEDFSYAQEAIANGTDSYLLKHSVDEQTLIREIHRIYEQNAHNGRARVPGVHTSDKEESLQEDGRYVLGIVRFGNPDRSGGSREDITEGTMLVHLMEDIVNRAGMGTLFAPYDRESFIVFRFERDCGEREIRDRLTTNISTIGKNIRQYFNGRIAYGMSASFTDLREMRTRYQEAQSALEQEFYHSEEEIFWYRPATEEWKAPTWTTGQFLTEHGMEVYEEELQNSLQLAAHCRADVHILKDSMTHACLMMRYQVIRENHLEEFYKDGHSAEVALIAAITDARTRQQMQEQILQNVAAFRTDVLALFERDDLAGAIQYIEQHLADKVTLTELAEISHMSIPTFSKRFKDRTGMTLVHYLNEQRVMQVKALLRNRNLSLWEIAEQTGFSNTNYLVRVFRKVTGQTVSDYRSQLGIDDSQN